MKATGLLLPVLALVLGFALCGWLAWTWQANAYGKDLAEQADAYSRDCGQAAAAVINWQEIQQAARRALEDRRQANDDIHYKELRDAQTDQARLCDRLATADVRLSVVLVSTEPTSGCSVPTTTATGRVVHGPARAQLDRKHTQRVIRITDAGDQGLIALRACQVYAKEVSSVK
ncbi:lysis system i-spanin subunit Rz [Pseudomonas saponiphila]|uniref:Bacteriophage Rz lysis protein n=1 Tax=Pseudomonas saponiphila TaxID=556534 RepID=A0A1H4XHD1_9PSED|nr:lysis system i-spanin subunit Rz [Pseudomonas saponiphila]SED05016.1 hypothetical protein SAMN05216178_5998 [Pseudomonas saponiphila]